MLILKGRKQKLTYYLFQVLIGLIFAALILSSLVSHYILQSNYFLEALFLIILAVIDFIVNYFILKNNVAVSKHVIFGVMTTLLVALTDLFVMLFFIIRVGN